MSNFTRQQAIDAKCKDCSQNSHPSFRVLPMTNDLTGKKFGRLLVLGKSDRQYFGPHWKCRCRCGNITEVRAGNLKAGHTRSCGCLVRDQARINISLAWGISRAGSAG